jgi:pyruvate-formate lyase-activating enzyme
MGAEIMVGYYPKVGVCYAHRERDKIFMIYTFRCNAECSHCYTESSPHARGKLSPSAASSIVEQGASFGKCFLVLSGGEPMLYADEVYALSRRARELGYFVAVGTNAFWAKDRDRALRCLEQLAEAGVKALFPSSSGFHTAFVPAERVALVQELAPEHGLVCEINYYVSGDEREDQRIRDVLHLDQTVYYTDGLITQGRDVSAFAHLYRTRHPSELDDCGSIHLGVNPLMRAVASCNIARDNDHFAGTPLDLGHFDEHTFERVLVAERDSPILQFLYHHPYPALHRLLREHPRVGERYREVYEPRRYYGVVDFYLDVFRDAMLAPHLEEACAAASSASPAP